MGSPIPIAISEAVVAIVSRAAPSAITGFTPAQGGCINHGGKLHTTTGNFFLKWNQITGLQRMFESESDGLKLLRATRAIHVPEVIADEEADGYQFLLLEYVEQGHHRNDYWTLLGHQLAALHRTHASGYGLESNNYIGSIPQSNTRHSSWREFFISQRLTPLLESAIQQKRAAVNWPKQFEQLFKKIDSLLPEEAASLVHGDLWQGNILVNALGAPCLIDPAVYYGHREVDLAMTRLFGDFDPVFYDAYREVYPLLPGFEERFEIYNLYPLLVHLLLFGGPYATPIQSTLNRFS